MRKVFDQAAIYAVLARIASLGVGFGTLLLITRYLSDIERGFYLTFYSIIALQVFFEMGFGSILIQYAGHEFAHLNWSKLNYIEGTIHHRNRYYSLIKLSVKWYAVIAFLFTIVLIPVGLVFFNHHQDAQPAHWRMVWIVLVVITALNLYLSPFLSLLEGAGKVASVARMRLLQALTGAFLGWSAMITGLGLWAAPAITFGTFLVSLIWLIMHFRQVLRTAIYTVIDRLDHQISWSREIFPMQWRIALSWMSGYLIYQLFNPIVFYQLGAKMAGKMGLSMAMVSALGTLAASWYATRIPAVANLIATQQVNAAVHLFKRTTVITTLFLIMMALIVFGFYKGLVSIYPTIADKFLSMDALCILMVAITANHIISCQAAFARTFKEEPYLYYSLVMAVLTLFIVFFGVHLLGIVGMLGLYLVLMVLVALPFSTLTLRYFMSQRL
ncbi:lipopolysaccharide biosynthesis protein [Aquirhabdus parva]|uniref:Polysaccharide biosynthesis protein n=1 Tax=Aquirhabdus parva TaxID=2283318 RepID=A0A345PAF6_9GAMM|nr:hypothetical protein [Aquirhabdus parva]AXI04265.1 hypothetical protein HYN46_16340 [Aquirhabdus parva]